MLNTAIFLIALGWGANAAEWLKTNYFTGDALP
jgi:hypothetical protein